MSYELFYEIFTIEKDGVYFPMAIHGSNNCWEASYYRNRRERVFSQPDWFFKDKTEEFNSIDEMKSAFDFKSVEEEIENGNMQGRYKKAQSVINALTKRVINYSGLNLTPKFNSMYYEKTLTDDEKEHISNVFDEMGYTTIMTAKEHAEMVECFYTKLSPFLVTAIKNYFKRFHFTHYNFDELGIKFALKKIAPKRTRHEVTHEEIDAMLDSPRAYVSRRSKYEVGMDSGKWLEQTEQDGKQFNQEVIDRFKGKRVYVRAKNGGVREGHVKERDNRPAFFAKGTYRSYYWLDISGGGYAEIGVDRIVAK